MEQFVVFQLAGQAYGFDIKSVSEIIRLQPMTSIPEVPTFFSGITSLRQKAIPVFDLRLRLGFSKGEETEQNRIIILDVKDSLIGVKVDAVLEVVNLTEKDLEPVPVYTQSMDADFLKGVGKWKNNFIILLEGDKLVPEEMAILTDKTA